MGDFLLDILSSYKEFCEFSMNKVASLPSTLHKHFLGLLWFYGFLAVGKGWDKWIKRTDFMSNLVSKFLCFLKVLLDVLESFFPLNCGYIVSTLTPSQISSFCLENGAILEMHLIHIYVLYIYIMKAKWLWRRRGAKCMCICHYGHLQNILLWKLKPYSNVGYIVCFWVFQDLIL